MVPLVSARDEDLASVIGKQTPGAFDFLIVEGVVLKETTLARRTAVELLGPGDILAPPLTGARQLESRAVSRYRAHGLVAIAVIEGRFRVVVQRWPSIADVLHDRLGQQTHRASMHLAMLHLPRVEERVIALFVDLAERFGHVSGEDVLIDLPLTHGLIGGMVGSRRPTVSVALHKLAAEGLLERLPGGRWRLTRRLVSP